MDIAIDCAAKLADLRSSGLSSPTARKDFLDNPIKIGKPKLLILDEPTSAMDSDAENNIMNHIFNLPYKPTIVMITHKIQHLMNMDKIAIILQGKVARFGPKDEVIKQQENNA